MSQKQSINIVTLGCSKNLVDSEKILGQLPATKFELRHDSDQPSDIVIINTCGFIHDAKEESIETILEYVEAARQGFVKEVIVTGCLSERYHEVLKEEVPEVNAWFGVKDTAELFTYLKQKYNALGQERLLATPFHYAYLKIAEGCDRTCSFCAIPLIRGRYESRTMESLEEEARQLGARGVKEVLLIAQDLSYYGYDLQRKSLLAPLLHKLAAIKGIEWLRLHYAYPKNFPGELIELMASEPKICRYLDIPLQHISDPVLQSMRRNTSRAEIEELILSLRQQIPGIALRTTMLVGFPGETRQQYEELLDFVRQARFERLGVFTYSHEEDTRAYDLNDNLHPEEKQERAQRLMNLQAEISMELNQAKVGQSFKVLIDKEEEDYFSGRTEFDSPEVDNEVLVEKSPDITPGNFYDVKIHTASEFELYGQKV